MAVLVFCLATIIVSYGMLFATNCAVLKDMADAGYKFKRISDLTLPMSIMLKPVYNVCYVIKYSYKYNIDVYDSFLMLKKEGFLTEMSDLEVEEYRKKPTALNAFLAPIRVEIRLEDADWIEIQIEGQTGEIFYESDSSFEKIVILKATGIAKDLSPIEQKEKIRNTWNQATCFLMQKFGSIENVEREVKNSVKNNCDIFDLAFENEEDELDNLNPTYREHIEELERLRNQVVSWAREASIMKKESELKNEGPKLIK